MDHEEKISKLQEQLNEALIKQVELEFTLRNKDKTISHLKETIEGLKDIIANQKQIIEGLRKAIANGLDEGR